MYGRSSNIFERPFVSQRYDSNDEIDRLKYGYGFDCCVEVFGQPVEEEFGPEKAFQRCSDLVCEVVLVEGDKIRGYYLTCCSCEAD